jgi:hypothetical protein
MVWEIRMEKSTGKERMGWESIRIGGYAVTMNACLYYVCLVLMLLIPVAAVPSLLVHFIFCSCI